jgi:hypothetical protein
LKVKGRPRVIVMERYGAIHVGDKLDDVCEFHRLAFFARGSIRRELCARTQE